MQITKNAVVSVSYALHEKTIDGKLIEKTADEQPFTFLFGVNSLIPDFEKNLDGLQVGENFSFGIEAANAYGLKDDRNVVDLPIEAFVVDGELASELLQVGKVIPMRGQDGEVMHGQVAGVSDTIIKMDFNHPMAGTDLFFTGQVLNIREATASELEHGHVHGPDGHHHDH